MNWIDFQVLCLGLACSILRFLYISYIQSPWGVIPFELIQGEIDLLGLELGPDWDLNSYKQIDPKNKAICLDL